MKLVGLTGGIGSGKTTVAKMFVALGTPVYNSDLEAKKLMRKSKKLKKAIIELFGEEAYRDEKLNKKYLSDQVFNDSTLLQKLNALVHPAVRKHFLKWVRQQNTPFVIQETAIIFENKMQDFYDEVILVVAPEESRFQRVMKRDGVQREQVETRMKHQLSDEKKKLLSDYVIDNIDLETTTLKVAEVNRALLENS